MSKAKMDRERIRECLSGPIASIRTAFGRSGEVDWAGTREQIEFAIQAGSRTVLLTAGDSHFFCLSEAEIAELTRVTVEQTRGRALVVAADRQYATGAAVAFAEYCRETGADVLMTLPPDWAQSSTPATLAAHYAAVSAAMPVMLVTNLFIPRGEAFGLATVRETLARVPNVVAVKDDMGGRFAQRLCLLANAQWAIFAGGQKANHLNLHPYGCDGYLSTFITFKPEVSHRYWGAIQANDLAAAREIIAGVDMPFFELMMGQPGGFDAGLHGLLELVGRCGRWRRRPYYSLSDSELESLAEGLRRLGLL